MGKVEKFHVLHDKVALLSTIGNDLSMEQEIKSKYFLDRLGIDVHKTLIKRWIFDNSD